jgi:hypothetical protein
MSHEFLLHLHRRSSLVQPRAVRVAERVPADAAEERDQNLRNFKESMEILATRNDCTPLPPSPAAMASISNVSSRKPGESAKTCPIVVGIFISWRGRIVYNDFFHLFTYANRRAAANRVGAP